MLIPTALAVALALGACGAISERMSELTDTTLAERCDRYRHDLVVAQAGLDAIRGRAPTAVETARRDAAAAAIDLYCGPDGPAD